MPASSLLVTLLCIQNTVSFPKTWVIHLNTGESGKANICFAHHYNEMTREKERGLGMALILSAARVCHPENRSPLTSRELIVLPGKKSGSFLLKKFGSLDGPGRIKAKPSFSFIKKESQEKNQLSRSYAQPSCNSSMLIAGRLHMKTYYTRKLVDEDCPIQHQLLMQT